MKQKFSRRKFLIILRDILTIFIGYSLTDLIVEHYNIPEKYDLLIYLGILFVITIIGITSERFIRKQISKK